MAKIDTLFRTKTAGAAHSPYKGVSLFPPPPPTPWHRPQDLRAFHLGVPPGVIIDIF